MTIGEMLGCPRPKKIYIIPTDIDYQRINEREDMVEIKYSNPYDTYPGGFVFVISTVMTIILCISVMLL